MAGKNTADVAIAMPLPKRISGLTRNTRLQNHHHNSSHSLSGLASVMPHSGNGMTASSNPISFANSLSRFESLSINETNGAAIGTLPIGATVAAVGAPPHRSNAPVLASVAGPRIGVGQLALDHLLHYRPHHGDQNRTDDHYGLQSNLPRRPCSAPPLDHPSTSLVQEPATTMSIDRDAHQEVAAAQPRLQWLCSTPRIIESVPSPAAAPLPPQPSQRRASAMVRPSGPKRRNPGQAKTAAFHASAGLSISTFGQESSSSNGSRNGNNGNNNADTDTRAASTNGMDVVSPVSALNSAAGDSHIPIVFDDIDALCELCNIMMTVPRVANPFPNRTRDRKPSVPFLNFFQDSGASDYSCFASPPASADISLHKRDIPGMRIYTDSHKSMASETLSSRFIPPYISENTTAPWSPSTTHGWGYNGGLA
ncbi:hypothetical protein BASA50_010263 [Batrachochytrium salamandrivorans]|uniref:Uncharacterized protein n=1 Tax=Batrachochytrium salamandrivorans TaxID=1357716 RepID=A0ABQ8F1Q6_9FUNG|nr:hypothetical protein BASA62_007144 [Batrachochytrium salamandrivorans]KAH6586350.1 hypothetical protein BASA61_006580 [Batrachochytrium salamandrivorans]KAH6589098.1 hypothetical protein BASA50_010263 [Batrachochytrium salamandrivorans]KAH9247662.1 hypothetical protein BASA81_014746 [Batrachochytrium salamandrivorans]